MQRRFGFCFLALFACAQLGRGATPATDQFGKPQPLEEGGSGVVTVVDFSASWCDPCWKTLPRLQELADRTPAARFVVVDVDDEAGGRDRLVEGLKLRLPVVWDEGHRLAERFAPQGMPAVFVLDGAGRIVYRHVGSDPKDWDKFADAVAHAAAGP